MFDFSLYELKERLRNRIDELGATSHTPLTKAVPWANDPNTWVAQYGNMLVTMAATRSQSKEHSYRAQQVKTGVLLQRKGAQNAICCQGNINFHKTAAR